MVLVAKSYAPLVRITGNGVPRRIRYQSTGTVKAKCRGCRAGGHSVRDRPTGSTRACGPGRGKGADRNGEACLDKADLACASFGLPLPDLSVKAWTVSPKATITESASSAARGSPSGRQTLAQGVSPRNAICNEESTGTGRKKTSHLKHHTDSGPLSWKSSSIGYPPRSLTLAAPYDGAAQAPERRCLLSDLAARSAMGTPSRSRRRNVCEPQPGAGRRSGSVVIDSPYRRAACPSACIA
jgi:hypothetical protein